jgi:hypothetical protein
MQTSPRQVVRHEATHYSFLPRPTAGESHDSSTPVQHEGSALTAVGDIASRGEHRPPSGRNGHYRPVHDDCRNPYGRIPGQRPGDDRIPRAPGRCRAGYVALAFDRHGGRHLEDAEEMWARFMPLLADPDRMRGIRDIIVDLLFECPSVMG